MRLMEHHDNSQMVKRENSAHSSPAPTPSPPLQNIRLNTTIRLTTMFDDVRTGKVAAYDPGTNLVTLHMKGSKPGLTTVVVFNLAHCRDYHVVQEATDDVLEPLYPIDINKVRTTNLEVKDDDDMAIGFI